MKQYYGYIRVSTAKQGERGSSLQEQRAAIEAYAQRFSLSILEWFDERETAAKRGRTMFNKMLSALAKGRAAGVLIHKIDRSARNLKDWADLGELIDRGIEVHFAHESLDLHSRGGRLSADIQAVVAADYIRNLRDEVRKGFIGRLKQGLYPLPAPVGYTDEGRGLPKLPNKLTAPLVVRAFELYATGQYTIDTIGEELYRLGLRNRNGTRLSRNGISRMLNNEFYVGIVHILKSGDRYQGTHTALIKKSLFDRVQTILNGRGRSGGWKHAFLYRRGLRCKHCRYSLIPEQQKDHVYYRCHTKSCPKTCLREDRIDEQLKAGLAKLRMLPDERMELWQLVKKHETDADLHRSQEIQSIRLVFSAISDRLGRLTDAYIDRSIDKELFEERKASLLHERAALQDKLLRTESGQESVTNSAKTFLELVESLSDTITQTNRLERYDLIKRTTSNLLADQNNVVFSWVPPFNALASREFFNDGGPHRDRPRTLSKEEFPRSKSGQHEATPVVHKIFREFLKKDSSRMETYSV